MKVVRLSGLALVAVLAMSLMIASVASAAPVFTPTGATLTGTSGVGTLEAAGEVVKCETDTAGGTVTSATLIGGIVVHFLGCSAKTVAGGTCTVKSTNTTAAGLILTNTLHGVLGLILPVPTPPASDVALVLLPISGSTFVTLVGSGTCVETTKVQGSVAGVLSPVGVSQTTGKLVLTGSAGKESITDVDLSTGGLVAPELKAFGSSASEQTEENYTLSKATEVT
jgi:hypothetical protein